MFPESILKLPQAWNPTTLGGPKSPDGMHMGSIDFAV